MSEKELTLDLSEETYRLIAGADAEVQQASERRNLILSATFAVARIPVAAVNRIDRVGERYVLYYTTPNGKPEGS